MCLYIRTFTVTPLPTIFISFSLLYIYYNVQRREKLLDYSFFFWLCSRVVEAACFLGVCCACLLQGCMGEELDVGKAGILA